MNFCIMLAQLVGVSGRAYKDEAVEMVYHKTIKGKNSNLGIMCKTCRMTFSLQIAKADSLNPQTLKKMQTSLGRWLGVSEAVHQASAY